MSYTYFTFRIFDIIYEITLVNKEQIKCSLNISDM